MEEKQLPKERTKDEILHSRPIVSNNKGSDLYVSLESARIAMQTYADQYASKLHQANEIIKVLTYDNNRLKGKVEGLTSAVEELKGNYKQPALPADDAVQNWFEENIDKECSASSAIYKFRQWLESLQVGWTPADTKPEHNVGVLVFIPGEDNHITSGMWDISNKWVLLDEYRTPEEEVTHWMPLPGFPEGYTWNEIPDDLVDALKKVAKDEIGKRESAAGREDDKAHFDNWHRWLSDNGYTYDGEYYYDEDNNYFTPDQLWVKFK